MRRLVTPKYNPARTFTWEGTVGLGGAYLCIYPMNSPGGYQLMGRTLPIWSTHAAAPPFSPAKPWLLEIFDQIRFHEVSEAELDAQRARFAAGALALDITREEFDFGAHARHCASMAGDTDAWRARQAEASAACAAPAVSAPSAAAAIIAAVKRGVDAMVVSPVAAQAKDRDHVLKGRAPAARPEAANRPPACGRCATETPQRTVKATPLELR